MMFVFSLLIGCANITGSNQPQIAGMSLSATQQEVVSLISSLNNEILLFEYTLGDRLNEVEVWVEIYHYGEYMEEVARLHIMGDQTIPLEDGQLAIQINQFGNKEYRWTISVNGASTFSDTWIAKEDDMSSSFGAITDPVSIANGEEVILSISKLTTGNSISTLNDLQYYLEHPEELNDYTYVHIIKARFLE
jgi:hypothetical protein